MAVLSTTTVYRGLKAFSNARDHQRSLILGLADILCLRHARVAARRMASYDFKGILDAHPVELRL